MATATFYADADARVEEYQPDGADGTLQFLTIGNISGQYADWSLIKFPISGIPSNAIISSAILTLTQYGSGSTESGTLRTYTDRCTSSWVESTVTWRTGMPSVTTSGRVTADFTGTADGTKFNINITAIAQAWINSSAANYGVRISFYDSSSYDQLKYFRSREYGTTSYRPVLVITYTLPATAPPLQVNIADAWRTTNAIYVNVSDVWREISNAYVNIGDTWREIT